MILFTSFVTNFEIFSDLDPVSIVLFQLKLLREKTEKLR